MIELKNDKLHFAFPDLHRMRIARFLSNEPSGFPMTTKPGCCHLGLAVFQVMLFQFKGWMSCAGFLPAGRDMLAEFTCRVAAGSNDWFASKSLLVVWRAGNLL